MNSQNSKNPLKNPGWHPSIDRYPVFPVHCLPSYKCNKKGPGGKSGDKRKERSVTAGKISNMFPTGNSSVNWEIGRKARTEAEWGGEGGLTWGGFTWVCTCDGKNTKKNSFSLLLCHFKKITFKVVQFFTIFFYQGDTSWTPFFL